MIMFLVGYFRIMKLQKILPSEKNLTMLKQKQIFTAITFYTLIWYCLWEYTGIIFFAQTTDWAIAIYIF